MNYYTGIGSREIPPEIKNLMKEIATRLRELGYILRSGGADGSDTAFELGAKKRKEIYLPWKGFNNRKSKRFEISNDALELAETLHPGWNYLKSPARKLMARNCYQILGEDLKTKSDFVVCWTKDGCESHSQRSSKTGGTGQAISLASKNKINVFNLFNEKSKDNFLGLLDDMEKLQNLEEKECRTENKAD